MKNRIRVAIALCLTAPFILREISGALEPYPAVLQPSGAHKVSTNSTLLEFRETQLFTLQKGNAQTNGTQTDGTQTEDAQTENTQQHTAKEKAVRRVDTTAFMGNIPSHYWEHLAIASYGLAEGKSQSASLGRWTLSATTIKSASPKERETALNWIHARLSAQGIHNADTLRIRYVKKFWDIEANTEVKREIKREIDVDITK
ncbi:MAG: hypothetical protein AAF810_16790 [Cyanobacteria bacterium P01_D01_bin.36]